MTGSGRVLRGARLGRAPVAIATAVGMLAYSVLLTVSARPAAAANPPPPPPPMFSCTPDVTATAQEQADFATRWADRVLGADPTFNLQDYVNAADIPASIQAEVGFAPATADTLTRGCLTSKLFDALKPRDPTFGIDTSANPPAPFPDDTVKSALAMTVFHNQPKSTTPDPVPAPPVPLPDPVTTALNNLGLNQLQNVSVPAIQVPSNLALPTPATALMGDLLSLIHGNGLGAIPPLGGLLHVPALPIALPKLPLDLPSLPDAINLARSVIDSLTFTICWTSPRQVGQVCKDKNPIGVPVFLDVVGDSLPDLTVQLTPTVTAQNPTGISMKFSVDRTIDPRQGLFNPPPVPAWLAVGWDIPLAGARAYLGFIGKNTLPTHGDVTATLTNIQDATNGNPNLVYSINQKNPDAISTVIAGVGKVYRDGTATGTPKVTDTTIGYFDFAPVPTKVSGTLHIQTTSAGLGKTRYTTTIAPSIPTTFQLLLMHRYAPSDNSACCPMETFYGLVDQLPTSASLDIIKDGPTNRWTVGYVANATINHLLLQGFDNPHTSGLQITAADKQNMTSFSAEAKGVPSKVDVDALLPATGANPRTFDINYIGSQASDPNALVTIPEVNVATAEVSAGNLQNSFSGHAEQIPGHVHVVGSLAGSALNKPAGPDLDLDLTYDSSGSAKNLHVDYFDNGSDGTTKLSGTIASLPPWFHTVVGSHPHNQSVLFNAKSSASAADASAALGTVNVAFAKNADFLNLGSSKPTTDQYAVVDSGNGADNVASTTDDTLALEAVYTGLKSTVVSLSSDGTPKGVLDMHANVVTDAVHSMTARLDSPDSLVDAEVHDVPKSVDVTYHRAVAGTDACGATQNSHRVVYDAANTIDQAKVRIRGKNPDGTFDTGNDVAVTAGRDPDLHTGPIPKHMELYANEVSHQVSYRANSSMGQVAATVINDHAVTSSCSSNNALNVDVRGLPTSFGAVIDPERLRLSDLASDTAPIDQVGNDETKPLPGLRSIALAFTNHPMGAIPAIPNVDKLSVVSNAKDKTVEANVRLEGVRLFTMDLVHADPNDSNSKVKEVKGTLKLVSTIQDLGTYLDFISTANEESQVLGTMKLPTDLTLDLGLEDGKTEMQYQTPGGHLDINLVIGLGTFGSLNNVSLPATLPTGVIMRDAACQCAKKVGLLLLGAPSTLDVKIDNITNETRGTNDAPFLTFTDYQPPGGSADLGVDVELVHNSDPAKDLKLHAVLHNVPAGYSVRVLPIATGAKDSPDTYFDLGVQGNKAFGPLSLDVGTGVPKKSPSPIPCSACAMQLSSTISNLTPHLGFHIEQGPSAADAARKEMHINMRLADAQDVVGGSIDQVKLNMLSWQNKPGTQTPRTEPQVQTTLHDIPSTIDIVISDGVKSDDSKAKPCQKPSNTLPGINYTASGDKLDDLDINAKVDFVLLSDDPFHPDATQPLLEAGVTDLSHTLSFQNTHDGKFDIGKTEAGPATGNIHLEVGNLAPMALVNLSLKPRSENGCGFGFDIGPVRIESAGGIAFDLQTGIVLDISGLNSLEMEPGLITHVDGDFGEVKFGLRDPHLVNVYVSGLGLKIKVRISDSIQPSFPLVFPPVFIDNASFPININMINLGVSNTESNWIDINLLVPCSVDVSWDGVDVTSFHGVVTTKPSLFGTWQNGFDLSGGDNDVLMFPFGNLFPSPLKFIAQGLFTLLDGGHFGAGIKCP